MLEARRAVAVLINAEPRELIGMEPQQHPGTLQPREHAEEPPELNMFQAISDESATDWLRNVWEHAAPPVDEKVQADPADAAVALMRRLEAVAGEALSLEAALLRVPALIGFDEDVEDDDAVASFTAPLRKAASYLTDRSEDLLLVLDATPESRVNGVKALRNWMAAWRSNGKACQGVGGDAELEGELRTLGDALGASKFAKGPEGSARLTPLRALAMLVVPGLSSCRSELSLGV